MSRELSLAIHLVAIAAILVTVAVVALQHPYAADMLAAGAAGFLGGIVFDRLVLVPVVDWVSARSRA